MEATGRACTFNDSISKLRQLEGQSCRFPSVSSISMSVSGRDSRQAKQFQMKRLVIKSAVMAEFCLEAATAALKKWTEARSGIPDVVSIRDLHAFGVASARKHRRKACRPPSRSQVQGQVDPGFPSAL